MASHTFNIPRRTLCRHIKEKVKCPGEVTMGKSPVLLNAYEDELTLHIQQMEKAYLV